MVPYGKVKNTIVVQGNPEDHGFSVFRNSRVVSAVNANGISSPGLISGSVAIRMECPNDVKIGHWEWPWTENGGLHKDSPDRPYFNQAKTLAGTQTTHEWRRLLRLTRETYGEEIAQALLHAWAEDQEAAEAVCSK